jgi:hypothetical protein
MDQLIDEDWVQPGLQRPGTPSKHLILMPESTLVACPPCVDGLHVLWATIKIVNM